MQIALFGGRFDPVHNGHVAIANEVLRAVPSVDEVWMVPDNQHHWNPTVATAQQRVDMLRLIENDPSTNAQGRIKVSDIGIQVSSKRDGMTVTIDVIRALQGSSEFEYLRHPKLDSGSQEERPHPNPLTTGALRSNGHLKEEGNQERIPSRNTYIFIAGSDQLPRLHEWHEYTELHMRLPFLIFPRKGYQTEGELPEGCMWLSDTQFEPIDDSATRVRQYLKEGKDISELVPEKVAEYIKEHELYK